MTFKRFLTFTFIFCFSLLSGLYLYHLYKYPKFQSLERLLKWYPKEILLKTGGYLKTPEKRVQYFLNFPPLKQKGVTRIGVFGDSFTYGTEVGKKGSYPYFLQQLFNKEFPQKKIEVLNFGVSGHGFQEQFFLWEEYSKKYSLDYILLGPGCFQSNRDLTFGKLIHKKRPLLGAKNRFILSEGGRLKEVFLKGNTREQRLEKYYQLIPSPTALLYDRNPFEALEQMFLPFLKDRIPNPFYYKKISEAEETVQINSLLLNKIKDLYNKKILFFTLNRPIFNQYQPNAALYNLNFIPFPKNNEPLYKVFIHKSSLGNEFIAKIFFNALTGKKDFHIKTIRCHFANNKPSREAPIKNPDLYKVESIQLTNGKNIFSTLRQNSSNHHYKKGTYKKHKTKKTKSFISLSPPFSGAPFFPVSVKLKEQMKIYIQSENGDKTELGPIKALDSYKKFFVLQQNHIHELDDTYAHRSSYLIVKEDRLHKHRENERKKFQVFIENHKMGTLSESKYPFPEQQKNVFKFIPHQGYKKSFLMMGFGGPIREKDIPDEFPVYLQYNMENGEKLKSSAHGKCKKENQKIRLNLPNFKPL